MLCMLFNYSYCRTIPHFLTPTMFPKHWYLGIYTVVAKAKEDTRPPSFQIVFLYHLIYIIYYYQACQTTIQLQALLVKFTMYACMQTYTADWHAEKRGETLLLPRHGINTINDFFLHYRLNNATIVCCNKTETNR